MSVIDSAASPDRKAIHSRQTNDRVFRAAIVRICAPYCNLPKAGCKGIVLLGSPDRAKRSINDTQWSFLPAIIIVIDNYRASPQFFDAEKHEFLVLFTSAPTSLEQMRLS